MTKNVDDFKKDFDILLKKYDVGSVMLVIGLIQETGIMDEAVLVRGKSLHLGHLLGQAAVHEGKVKEIIDISEKEYVQVNMNTFPFSYSKDERKN